MVPNLCANYKVCKTQKSFFQRNFMAAEQSVIRFEKDDMFEIL